ncbi:hypothetical protein QMA60_10220 [Leuconostoc suionicum]|jgi:type I restriction enzyme R subunit|nr:hypothetical protein [Leuconostoc suionicum]MDI6503095.1 hypothetical protein [Leuconostoc suionicum]MDI6552058.1 hypothetical protein [Leuconostoc suionicum]MDI6614975.1 hypothetical protein [Leuconostoc suionicum]MDI6665987.1 hypothetical protein [Leuconostoc suionicum]
MAEDKFEQAVIDKLKSEGWEYLTDYSGVTVDRLYDHWRDILNANNRKRLEDTPLSDNEFKQVKLELTKNKTPYDAQLMLAGAGGVGTVPLNRDIAQSESDLLAMISDLAVTDDSQPIIESAKQLLGGKHE